MSNLAAGGDGLENLQHRGDAVNQRDIHSFNLRPKRKTPVSDDQQVRFSIRQDVDVQPGGILANILGAGTIRVNSLHRQAIGRLGGNLTVEALAPDGTVEAVSVKNAKGFALGVQWHPEYWVTSDAPSRALFAAFGDAVRARMAARRMAAAE